MTIFHPGDHVNIIHQHWIKVLDGVNTGFVISVEQYGNGKTYLVDVQLDEEDPVDEEEPETIIFFDHELELDTSKPKPPQPVEIILD